jgi:hypothetical protein
MLMGNLFGRKIRPRAFTYTPLYYDPEKDPDRKDRIRFDQSPWMRRSHRGRVQSPWTLLALTVIVAGLILLLKYGFEDRWTKERVTLTPDDAAQADTTEVTIDVPH